jgi:endonuclease V-like protein UPF0215 family
MRFHTLGIDDAPFDKGQPEPVRIVAVLMEGNNLVEGMAVTEFPVDGTDATGFLADWIKTMRWEAALHAIVLGGITLAGLGLVDIEELAGRIGVPVLAVTRRETGKSRVGEALIAAGLADRLPIVDRSPPAIRVRPGLYMALAGTDREHAIALIEATLHKSRMPEPLRLAHLTASALAWGQSRGRV